MGRSRVGVGGRRTKRARGDDGAVLVEFAILAPLLFLIVFGIIDFGWLFLQNLDVRHGAREGIRLVAVNYNPNSNSGSAQTADIINEICNRVDKKQNVSVRIDQVGSSLAVGQTVRVTIRKDPIEQLTGYLAFALNNVTLSSSVETRLEQAGTWTPSPVSPANGTPCT